MGDRKSGNAPEQLYRLRFLAWRPVHAPAVDAPDHAIGGKLTVNNIHDRRLANALEPNSGKVDPAFREMRYASRYDGMMVIDVDFNLAQISPLFTEYLVQGLGYKYAEGAAFLAKELSGHHHYFHRRGQLPNMARNYFLFRIPKFVYQLLIIVLAAMFAFWPDGFTPLLALFGQPPLNVSDITRLDVVLVLIGLIGAEMIWHWSVVVNSRKNWPYGPESPSVVLIGSGPPDHKGFAEYPLPGAAPRARLDINTQDNIQSDQAAASPNPHTIFWMTDSWLAEQNAVPPKGATHTRCAIVQLRRRHLRVIEDALDAPLARGKKDDPGRQRKRPLVGERFRAIAWRVALATGIVLVAVLGLQMWFPADLEPMLKGVLFIALAFSAFAFVYYTCASYFWVARSANYFRNVLGYVTMTDVMNPVAQAIFRHAAAKKAQASPPVDAYARTVADFNDGRAALDVAIKQEEAALHTASFRATMAAAILAVTASLLALLSEKSADLETGGQGAGIVIEQSRQAATT